MILIEKTSVTGFKEAIRGMRNPMNSWDKSDSKALFPRGNNLAISEIVIGQADHDLMLKLAKGGSVHAKYRRMIVVYVDITAPLYWWKEFDTYKVGTVANSCSTMHKIHAKPFVVDDFSHEHLMIEKGDQRTIDSLAVMFDVIRSLNLARDAFLCTKDKKYWWQMIQLLPSSYNQKRTIMMNYEVLAGLYPMRKDHKLDEWHVFCEWVEGLPYSEVITGVAVEESI